MFIYKILTRQQWQIAVEEKRFLGSPIDLKHGFIHFSLKHQLLETAHKHFINQTDLILIKVDERKLGQNLKYEKSRGGQLFPHFYGALDFKLIEDVALFKADKNGKFRFPNF